MTGIPRTAFAPFAAFAAFGTLWGCWAAIVPLVQEEVGASEGTLGLALVAVGLGTVPAMLLVAPLVDRRGGSLMPWALAALSLAALGPAFADTVATLALAMLAWGACAGIVDVAINAAASEVEQRTGTRVMQLAHGLFSVGVLVGALTAGIAREFGAGRLEVLAGASVVLAAAALVNRHTPVPAHASSPRAGRGIRLRRHVVVLGVICFTAFLVEAGIEGWSALFMERELGARPLVAALAPAAYGLAMVVGRFAGQLLSDRVADRSLLVGGGLISAAGLLLAAASPTAPVAIAAFFVGGAGVSVAAPVAFSAAGRVVAPGERGSAVATVTTLGYLGLLVGPGLSGGVAELATLRGTFVMLAGFSILLALTGRRVRLA